MSTLIFITGKTHIVKRIFSKWVDNLQNSRNTSLKSLNNVHTIKASCYEQTIKHLILTVVHNATFEIKACGGMFKVIWDKVLSPNMRNPITATHPYIKTHNIKLHHHKKGNVKASAMHFPTTKNMKFCMYTRLSVPW